MMRFRAVSAHFRTISSSQSSSRESSRVAGVHKGVGRGIIPLNSPFIVSQGGFASVALFRIWIGAAVGLESKMSLDVRKQRHASAFADGFGSVLPYQLFLAEVKGPGRQQAFLEHPPSSE